MSGKIRGNRTLAGAWAEAWVNGDKIWELKKIEAKIIANREDVQLDNETDSKITGLKGELSMTVVKVYSRYATVFEDWKNGRDTRIQIITKLADPDAIGGQQERYSIDNIWLNELPLVSYEKGAAVEEEISGGFTPSDMINLDKIV